MCNISDLVFIPENNLIISVAINGEVIVWNISTKKAVCRYNVIQSTNPFPIGRVLIKRIPNTTKIIVILCLLAKVIVLDFVTGTIHSRQTISSINNIENAVLLSYK